jgi:hypothetical protein
VVFAGTDYPRSVWGHAGWAADVRRMAASSLMHRNAQLGPEPETSPASASAVVPVRRVAQVRGVATAVCGADRVNPLCPVMRLALTSSLIGPTGGSDLPGVELGGFDVAECGCAFLRAHPAADAVRWAW